MAPLFWAFAKAFTFSISFAVWYLCPSMGVVQQISWLPAAHNICYKPSNFIQVSYQSYEAYYAKCMHALWYDWFFYNIYQMVQYVSVDYMFYSVQNNKSLLSSYLSCLNVYNLTHFINTIILVDLWWTNTFCQNVI